MDLLPDMWKQERAFEITQSMETHIIYQETKTTFGLDLNSLSKRGYHLLL